MKLRKGRVILVLGIIAIIIGVIVYNVNRNNNSRKYEENMGGQTEYENSIRLGVSNFDTINPILTKNSGVMNVNKLVFEPLLEIDNNYKVKCCLAKEFAKTSLNTYIIKIDDSVQWSDGSKFTANDVKYTVNLIKSRQNIFSENVKDIERIDVIDDYTVKITLASEVPFFEYNLIFPIMSEKYYAGEDFFNSSKMPIGTGLYKIQSVKSNQIVFGKNENYRNKEKINERINTIYINIFSEIGEVYNGFKIGNVDILNLSSMQYKSYIGTLGYYVKEYAGREYDFLSCNCNDNIMKDKGVRQALNYVIDKENIISNIYNNEYLKSDYSLDYGSYLYSQSRNSITHNLEKAKEALIGSGWTYSNNSWKKNGRVLSITLSVNSSNKKRLEVANLIKEQLESMGIVIKIKELNDKEYQACLQNKNYQVLLTGVYNGNSPSVKYFYGENNLANYSNDEVNKTLKELNNITDEKILKAKYDELINITTADSPYIGLYRNKCSLIVNKKMSGNFEPNNYGIFNNFETWSREK